jgi:hypothetical protein
VVGDQRLNLGRGQARWMQRGSPMTSAGFWADPVKTGQLEDPVAQLVFVGMCAMLGCARCSSSGSSRGRGCGSPCTARHPVVLPDGDALRCTARRAAHGRRRGRLACHRPTVLLCHHGVRASKRPSAAGGRVGQTDQVRTDRKLEDARGSQHPRAALPSNGACPRPRLRR